MKGKIGGIDAGCLVRLYLAMKMFKLNSSVKLVGRRQKYLDAILSKEIPQFENFDSKIYQRIGYIESNNSPFPKISLTIVTILLRRNFDFVFLTCQPRSRNSLQSSLHLCNLDKHFQNRATQLTDIKKIFLPRNKIKIISRVLRKCSNFIIIIQNIFSYTIFPIYTYNTSRRRNNK